MRSQELLTRRSLLLLALGTPWSRLVAESRIPIALQLFSVRDECERDLPRTLTQVQAFGYEAVEFAGFYGWRATDIRKFLRAASLKVCGSHTPLGDLQGERFVETVTFNREIGNRNLIVPGLPAEFHSREGWARAAALFNGLADRLRPLGFRIGYHNHAIEFQPVEGQIPFDLFFGQTRRDVIMQVDLGNARLAGADPIALLRRYPGRATSIHVKDCRPGEPDILLGGSDFDWPALFRVCESTAGTEWYVIEHESKDLPSLAAAEEDLRRFQKLRKQ